MKRTIFVVCLLFFTHLIFSQEGIPASGGEAIGSGGSLSYSVSQLFYSTNAGSNGSISEGVQKSFELITLSNPELTTLTLTIVTYPNPTTNYIVLMLKNSNLKDLSYVFYDIQGRVVTEGKVEQTDTKIATQSFTAGTYVLKVNQNSKELKTFKVIKK